MNRVAFSIFGIDIMWYGILIASGMLLGILIAKYNSDKKKLNFDTMMDLILVALPSAIVGARLYYVVLEFNSYYKNHLGDIINIRQGGLAIHGGVIFALLAAFLLARKKKISFIKYADVAAPSIIIAQAIGRWGNFFNQEAHGGPVSYEFIKNFPSFIQKGMLIDGTYYHPTFLYESCWDIAVFIILMAIIHKTKKNGVTLFSYIGLYSIGRFFIEGLRTDSLMLGPLRMAQVVSLCGVIAWLVFLYFTYVKKKTILPAEE